MSKKKVIKTTLCSAMLAFSMNANAGIPTIDGAVLGQGFQELMEFVMQYTDQLEEWSEDLSRYENLTTSIDAKGMFDAIGLDTDTFADGFSSAFGRSAEEFLSGLTNKGIEGLSGEIMNKVKEAYPTIANPDTNEDIAKNAVSRSCGMRDGITLEIMKLDEMYGNVQKEAIKKTAAEVSKKLQGNKEDESASVAAGTTAVATVDASKLKMNDEQYRSQRDELIAQRAAQNAKCESSVSSLASIVGSAVGFTSKLDSLIFGSKSRKTKSFESDSRFK